MTEIRDVRREFNYDSAHRLPNVPAGHKCGRLHGHTYRLIVQITGHVDPRTGWVMDFADLDSEVDLILADLDHHYLNDVPGLENPTVENQLSWLWTELSKTLPLSKLTLFEGVRNSASYEGPL
jgi:6-pyruvoyltetrahydropterin/6-carboxytetrahydropterin synthase